jgi:hypothetical protein
MTDLKNYVLWVAGLEPFYRIILTFSMLVGLTALAAGAATQNPTFFVVGLGWLVGGSAVVWVADRRERR